MADQDRASATNCSQCGKPAVVIYAGHGLCAEHHLKLQQANYLQVSMLAAQLNVIRGDLEQGMGVELPRMHLPRPPFVGDTFTLNNINVSQSTIGAVNTGTIQNIDASITVMQSQGKDNLAAAVKELTEAVLKSSEVAQATKNDIAEQLAFLVAQATAQGQDRSLGLVRSVLGGLRSSISVAADLLTIWSRVEPLFQSAFGL